MSLNKTLDRLFDEIRREAKRNPEFADRLDAIMRVHESRRDVGEEVMEEIAREETPEPPPAPAPKARKTAASQTAAPAGKMPAGQEAPPLLNPVGIYKRSGEEALSTALATQELPALRALVAEHNLDPSGETVALDRAALAAHVVAQAKRRAERDEKMFDY